MLSKATSGSEISFRCPHCLLPLQGDIDDQTIGCTNGHRFDRSRDGYVNLIVGGRLAGGLAGDDDNMVRARRAVFDAGLYRPIIDAVAVTVTNSTTSTASRSVLDVGCGEGSYLDQITSREDVSGWGIDISKVAVRLAARRHRQHQYAVASCFHLPFADASFDVVVNVFSPRDFVEMGRVLKPGGLAVVVTPGPHHLAQIKAMIYDRPRQHPSIDADQSDVANADMTVLATHRVQFGLDLGDTSLRRHLLEMTPFWWSASAAQQLLITQSATMVDADMVIRTYQSPR